jgi:multisubunit Na+/H+ antiporter MnhF subunit
VNAFVVAAFALLLGFVPLGYVCIRERELDGVAALQLCGALTVLIFLCLGEGFHRSAYFDVPVICAATTWVGGLIFARFFGRYID